MREYEEEEARAWGGGVGVVGVDEAEARAEGGGVGVVGVGVVGIGEEEEARVLA